ncbi:hypothetical protein LOD99_15588 [Oopsacas minuta]|uniref:Uncharacterized protein n=1 Tax=Oopsacas minuta TaxID=111878 RepID=A0AAV7KAZ9_9METZ|nr:hypothetical protein LOD99_15588 [Oopsacas minuta]
MITNPSIKQYGVSVPNTSTYHHNLFRVSIAIAVLTFNDVGLSLFRILTDLGLSPSWQIYSAILKREYWSDYPRLAQKKSNYQRRRRRARLFMQQREGALLKVEGGRRYKGRQFGLRIPQGGNVSGFGADQYNSSASSSDESDTLCSIYHKIEPEPVTKRKLRKNQSDWI